MIYDAILRINKYCGACGSLMLNDRTPVEYTPFDDHFNNLFAENEMDENLCYYCEKNYKAPFLWFGDLKNYFCFPDGQIYSFSQRKIISPFLDNKGYPTIKIYTGTKGQFSNKGIVRKQIRVHKIVAMKYLPLYQYRGLLLRHLDDNKLNSHYTNLVWGTPLENRHDRIQNEKRKKLCSI